MRSTNSPMRRSACAVVLLLVFAFSLTAFQSPFAGGFKLTRDIRAALARISPDSLREHLKFIASDELEGRNTPSPGLDRAAEYIAAQFKKAGLEAVGDEGYFQTANWVQETRNPKTFALSINAGDRTVSVDPGQVSFSFPGALSLRGVSIVKLDLRNTALLSELKAGDLEGKVVITELPDLQGADPVRREALREARNAFLTRLRAANVALVLSIARFGVAGTGFSPGRLTDPENRPPAAAATQPAAALPIVSLMGTGAANLFDALPLGATGATLSINVEARAEVPVRLRNVVGVLRGSDRVLRETYVLVTAHYDHVGMDPNVPGPDKIFNGANDDGSGTVSVIEIAATLAKLKHRPKRSIVFMTVFGEEKGLLGSRYYGRHPIFPIAKTVAHVNLEQVGRTDDSEGLQLGTCAMTGFDFSEVGEVFQAAGDLVGVKVYKHPINSDAYFGRSDNQALADQGVPAHTLGVAFDFCDYHKVGDHWNKIDYDNMAKIDRMVTVGLLMIANNAREPKWNETNPRAARYLKAWQDRHTPANTVRP